MGKKKRENVGLEPIIPSKPTANITDAMRAEGSSEVFENANQPKTEMPPPPPKSDTSSYQAVTAYQLSSSDNSEASSRAANFVTSIKNKELKLEPKVKFTGEDQMLEFEGDLLEVYSQSSGTVSFDSFNAIAPTAVETIKSSGTRVVCKGPEAMNAFEENLLGTTCQPSLRTVYDSDLSQSTRSDGRSRVVSKRAQRKYTSFQACGFI